MNKNKSEERKNQLCEIYAHRGFHDKPTIPENSLPAFRRAIEAGFPVELDVHLIADGTLVVFHDSELERETCVKGEIEDYDIINLKKLRLEGTEEQIPTFDEVLELFENTHFPGMAQINCRAVATSQQGGAGRTPVGRKAADAARGTDQTAPQQSAGTDAAHGTDQTAPQQSDATDAAHGSDQTAPLLIELKVARGNYRELVAKVVERLDRYSGPFVVESFDPRAIIELRRVRPQIVRGQLSQDFSKAPEFMAGKWQIPVATNMWLNPLAKPDFIAYHYPDRANKALRRAVDKHGVREAVWTIRKPEDFVAARKAGCCAIFEKFDPREL